MPRSKRLSGCNTRCLVATTTQHSETLVALSRRREGGIRGIQSRWVVCSDELFTTRRVSTLRSGGAQVVSSGAVRGVRGRECASRAEAKRKPSKGGKRETRKRLRLSNALPKRQKQSYRIAV